MVVATEIALIPSHVSAFVYPLLLPLHWALAIRSGEWGRAVWALLAGAGAFWASWWYLTFLSKSHGGFVAIPWVVGAGSALLIWAMAGPRRTRHQQGAQN